MSAKTNAEVVIDGKVYTLSGYENEEYLQKVAAYINNKIAEFDDMDEYKHLPGNMKSTLIELNIADDYFKAKALVEKLEGDIENKDKEIEQEFKKYFPEIEMVHIRSPYSSITQSTIQYVDEVATQADKDNATLTVLIPQFVPKKSWQTILHNQMSLRLKYYLKWRENIVISSYSYHLKD